jgi:fucose permease
MNTGVLAINVGPLTHACVPARCVTTATGVVVGIGEVFGGAVAPAMAGAVAQRLGIAAVPWIATGAMSLALMIVLLAVREPSRVAAGNPVEAATPSA